LAAMALAREVLRSDQALLAPETPLIELISSPFIRDGWNAGLHPRCAAT